MGQLTATIKQNFDSSSHAKRPAETAPEAGAKGGNADSQVVHTMESIHKSSTKIADIIGVIDGIAFQTNILALNAAVEAGPPPPPPPPPRLGRRRGGPPRRRTRSRVCCGGQRSSQPGRSLGPGRQRNQGADRRICGQCERQLPTG